MLTEIDCVSCQTKHTIEMPESELERYLLGKELIQDIFPDRDSAIREMLVSGICPECWTKLFQKDSRSSKNV